MAPTDKEFGIIKEKCVKNEKNIEELFEKQEEIKEFVMNTDKNVMLLIRSLEDRFSMVIRPSKDKNNNIIAWIVGIMSGIGALITAVWSYLQAVSH